jgi:hypothetical protein
MDLADAKIEDEPIDYVHINSRKELQDYDI